MRRKGNCKLCHESKDLVSSHYIPSSIYKKCLENENGKINRAILLSKSQNEKHTIEASISVHAKDYVLCRDCEEKFNKNGETYFLSLYNNKSKLSKLKESLTCVKPIIQNNESSAYSHQVHKLSNKELCYFVLSIFWRGAINNWQIYRKPIERILLGPYEEPIRRFLLGSSIYPEHVYVGMWISNTDREGDYFRFPYTSKASNFHLHQFPVSNIHFTLSVGKNTHPSLKKFCLYSSEDKPIIVSTLVDKILLQSFKKYRLFFDPA